MNEPGEDGEARAGEGKHLPSSSARVRLEVALLANGADSPAQQTAAGSDVRPRFTVLIVADDSDVRRYVADSLASRADLRVVEAVTIDEARDQANQQPIDLIIVQWSETDAARILPGTRTIVIVEDATISLPDPARPQAAVLALAMPFNAQDLFATVDQLLDLGSAHR